MGFYGNITNTSKTNFVFDKIYTNRKAMDSNINKDGIFIGRYVLVEYGEITEDSFIRAYGPQTDGYYHISNDNEVTTRILYTTEPIPSKDNYIKKGQIIYILGIGGKYEFLECNGGVNKGKPSFSDEPGLDPKTDPYFYNLKQDQAEYNVSRGYDGTVWVKTSINNEIKYVNIAELNSVVPSFEMVADAPTMSPILPHFDTASNNVYYKLHWQPTWGMRIAETADGSDRFSDYVTSWSQEFYDSSTGTTTTKWYDPNKKEWVILDENVAPPVINADIYFNHAAFDPQIGKPIENINKVVGENDYVLIKDLTKEEYDRNKSKRIYYYKSGTKFIVATSAFRADREYYQKIENRIDITADGLSGNKYNLHDGTSNTKPQVDTQQIHINLPAIGNMMSEAWDIIHGPNRNNSTVDSLQGRLNFFKNEIAHNEIPVQSNEAEGEGYLVGSVINGATSYENSRDNSDSDKSVYNDNILEVEINSKKQHEHDDAWIATNIDTNQGKDGDDDYHRKAISIHHTFHKRIDSAINELNINEYDGTNNGSAEDPDTHFQKIINKDTIQLYVPKVDKAGHVVGTDIDKIVLPYGYKHIKTIGNKTSNKTTDLDTVQDQVSDDYATVTTGTPIGKTDIVANETQDTVNIDPFNKWIQVKASDDKVEIAHEVHGIVTKRKETDLNDGTNTITFHDLEFDAAGHVEKNQLHTYTLPYGYKQFTTNGKVDETNTADLYTTITSVSNENDTEVKANVSDNQKSCVANNTQDTLNIQTQNKWIQTAITNNNTGADSLVIAHEIHAIKDADAIGTNLNGGNISTITSDNIVIPDLKFDKAGHLTENHSHTYTLPYGYKTFTDGINRSVANSTQDTFTFIGDNWLEPTVANGKITYTHIGPVAKNARNISDITPKFGDAFDIEDWVFDDKGHKTNLSTHSIKIPGLSLINDTTGNIVTNVEYAYDTTNHKGSFTETKENVGTLALGTHTGTTITTNGLNILNTDTISEAFDKTQTHINSLKLDNQNATQFISKITQTNGQVAVERAAAGTLVLGKENKDYSVPETASAITYSDSLATAFGKVEAQIKAETVARQKEIADLINSAPEALDTLGEVAEWINNDETGAAAMANDISSLKTKVGEKTVNAQITEKINALDKPDKAVTGQYVSEVSEANGIISVSRENLPTLSSGTTNGTVKLSNGNDVAVTGLGSAAYTDISEYIRPKTEFVYDKIQENGAEKELKTTIEEMAKEIAILKQVLEDNGLITE